MSRRDHAAPDSAVRGHAAAAAQGSASEQVQQPPYRGEDDAAVDDIVVVTASRREEQLLNAPATMSVLTRGCDRECAGPERHGPAAARARAQHRPDRRRATSTSRAAPRRARSRIPCWCCWTGAPSTRTSSGSSRGTSCRSTRSEIKQIEVIRGPASAVWGANAMTGVVNVITKTPREMQGTSVAIRFGQFDRSRAGGRVRRRRALLDQRHACAGDERQVCLQGVGGRADTGTVSAADRDCCQARRRLPRIREQRNHAAEARCPRGLRPRRTGGRRSSWPAAFPGPKGSFTPGSGRSMSSADRRSSTAA